MQNTEINKIRDAVLVSRALKNADDFIEIVQLYESPIRRYITRLGCKDSNDVDDILQDVFLKVYINLNEYDSQLAFSSWLYRIAHNETISFFRKKSVRPQPVAHEEDLRLFENISDDIDFTKSLNTKMNVELLRKALAELEEQYRNVLVLKFLEEKSYTEVSDILKIPVGTVGTLINRGKKRLKDALVSKNITL